MRKALSFTFALTVMAALSASSSALDAGPDSGAIDSGTDSTVSGMILQGPLPVTFVPSNSQVQVDTIFFNLLSKTYYAQYHNPGIALSNKTISGAIPPNLLTSLESFVASSIESNEGWDAGSSIITKQ